MQVCYVDLDFRIDGPNGFTHADIKHPVGSHILKLQNSTMNIEEMAYNMGVKLSMQKERFCNVNQGPKTTYNVLLLQKLLKLQGKAEILFIKF